VSRKRTILRELGLALVAGVVFTVSPFVPNELPPAAAGGALVGGGVLAWRLRRASPVWQESAVARPAVAWSRERLLGVAVCLLCLSPFAPTVQWMYREWTKSIWANDHGIFIPFVMLWLARNALRKDSGPVESSAAGFLPLGAGLALAVIDANAQSHYLSAVGLLLALPGLSLLLLGERRTLALRVPLVISVLLVPIPYSLAGPLALRSITAAGVLPLLHAMGYSAVREGTLIVLPSGSFLVADACSGIATLYASLAAMLVLAATSRSHWRRIALLLAAPVLAIGSNVVRVTLLMVLADRFGIWLLDTKIHEASGVATFGVVLVSLLSIANLGVPREPAVR